MSDMALSGNRGWIPPESLKAMVLEEQDHKVQLGVKCSGFPHT